MTDDEIWTVLHAARVALVDDLELTGYPPSQADMCCPWRYLGETRGPA